MWGNRPCAHGTLSVNSEETLGSYKPVHIEIELSRDSPEIGRPLITMYEPPMLG